LRRKRARAGKDKKKKGGLMDFVVISYGDGEVEIPESFIAEERAMAVVNRRLGSSISHDEDELTLYYEALRRVAPRSFFRVIEGRSVII